MKHSATLSGAVAVLLWSSLAVLTVMTAPVPPFQLAAMTFGIAALSALIFVALRGRLPVLGTVGWRTVLAGTAGLFGYHALYFAALRLAPPAEAGLVAYLWPLLIIVFAGLLLGEPLRIPHYLGTLLGFAGMVLIVFGSGGPDFSTGAALGYALAFLCALTWSLYSVLSRRHAVVPTDAVALYCGATAVLALICHLTFEDTAAPKQLGGWLAILALGAGPVGAAFFLWDHGMKRGDIRVLGAASYAAPLLSTLILILAGQAEATTTLAIAAALIAGGAVLAALASRKDRD